jgi:hypothetical protein
MASSSRRTPSPTTPTEPMTSSDVMMFNMIRVVDIELGLLALNAADSLT